MKMKVAFLVTTALIFVPIASAATLYWNGGDGDWNVPGNWHTGAVPTGVDSAQNYLGGQMTVNDTRQVDNVLFAWAGYPQAGLTVTSTGNLSVNQYVQAGNGGTATLNIDGGSLSTGWNLNMSSCLGTQTSGSLAISTEFYLGYNGTGSEFNLYDGTVSVGTNLYMGNGETASLNVYGGSVTIPNYLALDVSGFDTNVNLYGGLITVDSQVVFDWAGVGNPGIINIEEGMLKIKGDWTGSVAGWETDGLVVAYDGTGILQAEAVGGYTEITAIPEPMSIALLAGGLILARRKK